MKYATFCWHYEDLMLNSINYHHWGEPKQWYCVPESDLDKFEKVCKQKLAVLSAKDPNILHDMVSLVSPAYLASQGVSGIPLSNFLTVIRDNVFPCVDQCL